MAKALIGLEVKKELKGKLPFSDLNELIKEEILYAAGQHKDCPVGDLS